ncbi:MAG: toxin-activating lysine-acyltransferase [Hyphomicrobiaceae bacterium]
MSVMTSNGQANGDNGSRAPAPAAKPADRIRDARQAHMGQAFSQVIAVLMRDPSFRQVRLADLEWLVIPPLMCGQYKLAQAPVQQLTGQQPDTAKPQEGGVLVPVAVGLWARVSAQVDKRLAETLDKNVRLRPSEWTSGEYLWLMAVAGDPRAVPHFVEQLAKSEFKGKQVKMRLRGADGKITIKTIGAASA